MKNNTAPASFALADVQSWIVSTVHRGTEEQRSRAAQLAHEWAASRAGQLHPDQRDDQVAACRDYIVTVMRGEATQQPEDGVVGTDLLSLFLAVVLPRLAMFVATLLLEYLFRPGVLAGWQAFAAEAGHGKDDEDAPTTA